MCKNPPNTRFMIASASSAVHEPEQVLKSQTRLAGGRATGDVVLHTIYNKTPHTPRGGVCCDDNYESSSNR